MSNEMQQLVLVKQLAQEAERQLARKDDFGNGLAVSLSQDAVELLLRETVRARNLPVAGNKATVDAMADAIDKAAIDDAHKVPHRERIGDLNKARIGFKHLGTAPSRADAERLVRYGVEFLEEACQRFFSLAYRAISLAHSARSDEVRGLLLESERLLAAGQFQAAMIEAADAVRAVDGALYGLLPPPRAPSLPSADGEQASRALLGYLNNLRLISLGALIGFDVRSLARFRALAPIVHRSAAGGRSEVILRGKVTDPEEALFCVTFAIDFALAVQARLD